MRKRAFTLIELLIVIAIMVILAGLLLPAAMKLIEHSNIKAAKAEMEAVRAALDEYYEDYGQWPQTVSDYGTDGIVGADLEKKYEIEIYIEDGKWLDAWGTEYFYTLKPDHNDLKKGAPVLVCFGPDCGPGEADINDKTGADGDGAVEDEAGWNDTDDIMVK